MYSTLSLNEIKNTDNLSETFFWNDIFYKGIISENPISDILIYRKENCYRQSKTLELHGNLYNMLLNELPSWQKFPLRKESIIFTNSENTARFFSIPQLKGNMKFGKLFHVIPLRKAIVITSSKNDLWYSFNKFFADIGIRKLSYSLIDFNQAFSLIARNFDFPEYDTSLSNFEILIQLIRNGLGNINLDIDTNIIYRDILSSDNYINDLNIKFSPENNNFQAHTESSFKKLETDRELWTDGDCILIAKDCFKDIITSLALDIDYHL